MYSSNVAFARSIRPMIKPRLFSSLTSSLAVPRVVAPKTLTLSRILSATPVPFASGTAVNPEDKIRRTDGDDDLLRVLQEVAPMEVELPKDSPFVIIDNSTGYKSIMLEREFQGEYIRVCACKLSNGVVDEDESEQDGAEGQNTDDDHQLDIALLITIDKAGLLWHFPGRLYEEDFEIGCMRLAMPEDSDAENVNFLHYSGPDISDWDEGLQRALTEYMGARGVNASLYRFLWEYIMKVCDRKYFMKAVDRNNFMKVDDRRYRVWFMNLKEFVDRVWFMNLKEFVDK